MIRLRWGGGWRGALRGASGCGAVALALQAGVAVAEPVEIPETVILAERLPTLALRALEADEIARRNPLTLDALLAEDPSFSLYRRQSALFGNPTSSGVSLRRAGATATARTLVLRDGIPQNDPFGGWISWARYDPRLVDAVRFLPAAEAAIWGNLSPAGTVQLSSRRATRPGGGLRGTLGTHETYGATLWHDAMSSDGRFTLQGGVFTLQSDGFHGLAAGQRGRVDRRLDLDTRGADLLAGWQLDPGSSLEASLSLFDEERGNGTVLSRNATEALDLSLRYTQEEVDRSWQAVAYYQHRQFEALFASVAADRSTESPALDQFDVPAQGFGGGVTATFAGSGGVELTVGADVRHLQGETNEDANFQDGLPRRRRTAGGEQSFAGIFVRAEGALGAGVAWKASVRLDGWQLRNGERRERNPQTDDVLRAERFATRRAAEPSLGLSLSREFAGGWTARVSGSSAFRAPTLNELYRPFRVRSDITEANPRLDPERFYSLDASLRWSPVPTLAWENAVFVHWIHDAIANVPLTDPQEIGRLGVFVPPGGRLAQRRNVDWARVAGFSSRVEWRPTERLGMELAYLFTETRFLEASTQELLEGAPFPHSPEHQLAASLLVRPRPELEFFASSVFASATFDDALGTRRLDPYLTINLGLQWELGDSLVLRGRIENLFDEEIETGLASNGLRSIGQPRTVWIGTELQW